MPPIVLVRRLLRTTSSLSAEVKTLTRINTVAQAPIGMPSLEDWIMSLFINIAMNTVKTVKI